MFFPYKNKIRYSLKKLNNLKNMNNYFKKDHIKNIF